MDVNATPKHLKSFQIKLLGWFSKHKRLLPWRLDGNPYRIFFVEIMLQQTQIKTVIPYYERWLKAFPTVETLAKAPLDQVLKLWEGLGYYSRARNLHRSAQLIVERFNGVIPSEVETLRTLPGIGPYTAGAIASIAYQKPVPLVDGNVFRVFARLFNDSSDISKPETQKKFYALAAHLISHKEPGNFNQALMELGSLICTPEAPQCPKCPVKSLCLSLKEGDPEKLPVKSNGLKVKKIQMAVALLARKNKILIRRRPAAGIWGGLWELPGTIRDRGETLEESLRREFQTEFGISIQIQKKAPEIIHRFTHRLAKIVPFYCQTEDSNHFTRSNRNLKWADSKILKQLSFPVPHQKILKKIAASDKR